MSQYLICANGQFVTVQAPTMDDAWAIAEDIAHTMTNGRPTWSVLKRI